ncbi:hypothetical protein JG688_00004061 [Phytophthora aleatoria]|uniref:FYVE-type domain-containing protein n=1 Tax=Phytophthora aleatoria TaxID=2496075 RepID=A0A8J5J2A3_9STRA|nr:hypothetical protein JG688_00004061 [Phytophthora aleatoria]
MVSTRIPLLTCVSVVWRERQESLGFLPHVAALISAYLDSSHLWNIPQALDYGFLHLLQRLGATSRRLRPLLNRSCFQSAAQRGDVALLQWLAAYDPDFNGYGGVLDHAAEHGQLEVVKWLDKTIPDLQASTKAMDLAAAHGHLEVVQWLHDNRSEGCSHHAIDEAGARGHVDVVEWLAAHRDEGGTKYAMNFAVCIHAMVFAAKRGGLELLKWLFEHKEGLLSPDAEDSSPLIMDHAAEHGHLDVVQWLHDNTTGGCTTDAMNGAARGGYLEIVEFLHEHRSEGCTNNAMDGAARGGHLEVVKFLHERRLEGCSYLAMDYAAAEGHLDVVEFLHSHRDEGCSPWAMNSAAGGGTTNGYGFRSAGGDALSIEMQFLNPRRRFPLADEYLPAVHVTEEQVEDLRETCEQLTADALEFTSMFPWEDSNNNDLVGEHREQWKVHYKRPHVTLYRKKRGVDVAADEQEDALDATNGGLRHFVVSGQIHDMSLEDVEYGLYCDATLDERAVMTDLYRELFLDAAVLRSFETQTPEDPFRFFGIKWLAHLSPADKFISPRDFAFVEYSQRVVGPKGESLLVKVQQSLGSEHVDAMNRREFDLVRAQMNCTTVYRHDKRANNVQVIARGYLDPCGSAPAIMTRSFLTRLAPTLVEVEHSADVKYIMRHGLVLPKEQFFARRNALKAHGRHRLQCTACGKRFGRFKRHLTQCRACGEAACGRCLMTFTLCLPHHEHRSAEHPSAVMPERFCLRCLYSSRLDRKGQRMDDFLLGGTLAASTTVPTVDDEEEVDDDDVSLEFAMLGDGPGAMHAAISEAQQLQRLKQRYLENEKRKYLGGHQQTAVQRFVTEQQYQMQHYEQSTRRVRPPITRRSSQPVMNGSSSVDSGSISSAYNSASSAYSSLSMGSSTYSSAEAAAAATAALQANAGLHEMEHSIGEQEALLRSLQNEYAKMSMNRSIQRAHSNPSFNAQEMREKRLAKWQAAERSNATTSASDRYYDIDD